MTRNRVYKKALAKGAMRYPAIRIEFRGKSQHDYFALMKAAEREYDMSQTGLAKAIIADWVKKWRVKEEGRGVEKSEIGKQLDLLGVMTGKQKKKKE